MAWFSDASDRRASPRFQAHVPLVASLVGDNKITCVHLLGDGISEGGISVPGLHDLVVGDPVSLEMHLPTAKQPIWVETVVRHSGRCGLQFVALSAEQLHLIRHYCRLQPREKLHP